MLIGVMKPLFEPISGENAGMFMNHLFQKSGRYTDLERKATIPTGFSEERRTRELAERNLGAMLRK